MEIIGGKPMHLKRLELFGFKSFADRTELEFDQRLNVIVGPNGSGKSNIADALRWVLGEQSIKSLRGTKMEDVIFSGSESRKPVNFAEVSMTLDNQDQTINIDFSEVTITRRVYRSGASEFFINQEPCRLKDIVELFMDTGLGREAYSIIGQGRIDEILNSRPEERRGVFEEAAGVVKYKNRKKEAEKKLEETAANLVRIQDIILEVEKQLTPLREEAERAKTYLELKERLTEKELAINVHLIDTTHDKWQETENKVQHLKTIEEAQLKQLNQLEAQFREIKEELAQLEQDLDHSQEKLLIMTEESNQLESHLDVLREREKNLKAKGDELHKRIDELRQRYNRSRQEWDVAKEERLKLITKIEEVTHNLKEMEGQAELSLAQLDNQLDQLKGEYIDTLNQQAALRNERRHLLSRKEQENQRLNRLRTEQEQLLQERNNLMEALEKGKGRLHSIQGEMKGKLDKVNQLSASKKELEKEFARQDQNLRHHLAQIEQLESRYKVLKELNEEYSGYARGAKEILKARPKLPGIYGAVGELIKVAPQYELAIETALGAALQYIVVQDEAAAREAIAYLKKKRYGRATFLPKNILKSRTLPAKDQAIVSQSEEAVGLASQLVETEEAYLPVIQYLLGQVIVMRTLKGANTLAGKLNYRYRLVTLEGDVVHPGGLMTGGSIKGESSGLLGRKRELSQIKEELANLRSQREKIKEKLFQLDGWREELDHSLIKLEEELKGLKGREEKEKETQSQLHYQLESLDEKIKLYSHETEEIQYQKEILTESLHQLDHRLAEVSHQCTALESKIKQLESYLKEQEEKKAEANEQLTRLKMDLAAKKQALDSFDQEVRRLAAEKDHFQRELNLASKELDNLHHALDEQQREEKKTRLALDTKREELKGLNDHIAALRERRKKKQTDQENLQRKIDELRKGLKENQEQIRHLEVKRERLDVELEQYLSLLRDEYGTSYEWAKERYPLTEPFDVTKQKAAQLKKELSKLGSVHVGAIEQYEELKGRYTFLKQQEDDLKQAKQKLEEVIRELDEEMNKRFKETFESIKTHFSRIFKELFGGGKANLILTDPANLLATGVDIVAQPPGKKLQNLSLLSGGERALTAIALLFAILEVKPVPFCVLDEVEAALDEANVHRFAKYLRNTMEKTQFIVITHRKGTMEEADVLYGITMSEAGVSKLVSIKLLAS